MFGWCSSLGVPTMGSSPDTERPPPPEPTPLDFPLYQLPDVPETASEASLAKFHEVLASIRRPQDISPQKFKDLNLKLESDVPITAIVSHDGAKSAPPLPWEMSSTDLSLGHRTDEQDSPVIMDNGNAYPPKQKFDQLETELLFDNDDAFREVSRLPPQPGRTRVRVAQARKFWIGLERMSQYWDASLDEYFERPKTPEPIGDDDMQTDGNGGHGDSAAAATTTATSGHESPMDVDNPPILPSPQETSAPEQSQQKQQQQQETVRKYRGRRIASGKDMPDDIREETIRALTEMAAWPFGCQVSLPITPPRLAVGKLLFPVRQTFKATRSPRDRALARNGMLEGPIFAAQCRTETSFRGPEDIPGYGFAETCDIVREVGSMLLTAQERAREGKTEVKPGEGKWWTIVPRWGGARNDAMGDISNVRQGGEKQNDRKRSKHDHPLLIARRSGGEGRKTNSEKWNMVQPGPSLWDRRLKYQQIGKPKDSPFDDIYMISSINHHLAILHLRVHRRYLDILTTGESDFPPDTIPDQPWHVLKLRRTRWYDLFEAQDRVEAFKGIWTIFHCLLRRM